MGVCYGLAALASIANSLAWWLRALALATILTGAAMAWQRLWRIPPVTQLRIGETGAWKLWTATGDEIPADILPSTIVVPWLILLHFRDENRRFHAVPLMPDSLETDGFRRLTVRLRTLSLAQPPSPLSQ